MYLLLPDLTLPFGPPFRHPWPGDPASSRPGQFCRLIRGPGDWDWGGIDSRQAAGAASWFQRSQPLLKRVQALRTLWDFRWHGQNKVAASHSQDAQSSACSICNRFWSQAHVLCDCPGARIGGSLDPTLTVNRLSPGPMFELGRKFHKLLSAFNQPTLWTTGPRGYSFTPIRNCALHQTKAVLGRIGQVTSTTASACWRDFTAMAKDLSPPADPTPPADTDGCPADEYH